ncbi:NUDIX domain-containing protein [Streptomyces clavuligerus]|uniref:Putative NTP pyrophosphohydrolase n=1 Tax=Streptomyces clavuligerus TaxID=1901 RepID=B5GW41_STRCL|nr:NUDIX domain-containing protein [Streptomyces clavuligerus]EDY50537.1 NUDIX hydrolase [Streptomyces clavuligerus]EFG03565.1 putative NTP pyrophosphohydrolase [Streptomyces clavuligerus]MBY6307854.1 NUDIX domain-containing protein [Streptomyces clavuligerus]QCS09593.1 NUDIX domain-containing protein [Streptomyces clavuligerus]QPJ98356.1 NUDIX domain-containing protein [Streptomyces clavuligerus]
MGIPAELVDFVDADDRPVSRGPRGRAQRAGLHYRVAATVLTAGPDRVLVYRRPAGARVFPGHHDVLVGGSVRAGESYLVAARRELAEEFGVRPELREVLRLPQPSPIGPCHLAVHLADIGELTGLLRPDRTEIDHCQLLSLARLLNDPPRPFVPTGVDVLHRLFA